MLFWKNRAPGYNLHFLRMQQICSCMFKIIIFLQDFNTNAENVSSSSNVLIFYLTYAQADCFRPKLMFIFFSWHSWHFLRDCQHIKGSFEVVHLFVLGPRDSWSLAAEQSGCGVPCWNISKDGRLSFVPMVEIGKMNLWLNPFISNSLTELAIKENL